MGKRNGQFSKTFSYYQSVRREKMTATLFAIKSPQNKKGHSHKRPPALHQHSEHRACHLLDN
ncbi:hypothetical protein HMPREF9103_00165 [Lentilactobacillus parafarraginis F0439]|uniref:Uncharacterized protein n=1 Tax=Lentilactobacillus parafarraginis F0439 TaxID=797515 RepID=G9ZKB7_9LACO|nr:hypothetical protein HMPREF9103_00165 [Lentilactobacillus parafarraginis F0439]